MSHNLSTAEVSRILGLPPHRVRQIVGSGLCRPARRGRSYAFSFQDLVVLRAARELLEARVPAARVRRALAALARELPPERPLSGLRIHAHGSEVAVCDGDASWQPETGQTLFRFGVDTLAREVELVREARSRPTPDAAIAVRARAEFENGLDLEDDAPAAACAAYRRALELDPGLVDALVNLGRLEHEAGRAKDAAALYREALERCADDAVIHFNLALALEDSEGPEAAARAYERAIALDADFADAHYNLAGLCEQLGRPTDALRHYRTYKNLTEG
ncbi:MAG: tetratricopeptide repeat protein [Myxococcota bacterium]|nr:tetratricopeptide repeat protein [Myxococcota bacterium]